MPVDTDFIRFDYSGAAVVTKLKTRALDTDVVLVLDDDSDTNYTTLPLAGNGLYASVTINRSGTNFERVYYSERIGNQLQGCLRGKDGTAALTHEAGESVEHGTRAQDISEANAVVVAIGGEDGATATHALTTAFSPTDATNAQGVYTGANTSNTWVPVYSSISDTSTVSSDGTPEARYYQVGKLVWFNINVHLRVLGGTGSGQIGITLPVNANLGLGNSLAQFHNDSAGYPARAGIYDTSHIAIAQNPLVNSGLWQTDGVYRWFRVSGVFEAA